MLAYRTLETLLAVNLSKCVSPAMHSADMGCMGCLTGFNRRGLKAQ